MRTPRQVRESILLLAVAAIAIAGFAPGTFAATREPLSQAFATRRSLTFGATGSRARPNPAALRAMARSSARRFASAADEFHISSTYYGPKVIASVAATLRSLDHGPEMSTLNVYVATPEEIRETCGATVIACYLPSESEMVVSGIDHPVDGVPRAFAIAHEYGHHIANTRQSSALPALEAGPIRWATYERVCQLTRAGRLYPGNQDAHYWQDPEEAFAESYADLNRPGADVSWQYTPLLRPTTASLAKLHADVRHPWRGPVTRSWSGTLPLAAAASRRVRTPLDGPVSVSLEASPGARLRVALRDPEHNRVLARAVTDSEGRAEISYPNCGHAWLRQEVGHAPRAGNFQAAITRP